MSYTEYSDNLINTFARTFEENWKNPRTPCVSNSVSYSGRHDRMTRISLAGSHLKTVAHRFSLCDDTITPFSCIALFNYSDWCHMALVKIRETPNDVPPLYPTSDEESEMQKGLNWLFDAAKYNHEIIEDPTTSDALISRLGVHPTLFVSSGFIHVQHDFVHSVVMDAKGHLIDYRYESAEERIKHGARLISMKTFYSELAQKIKGH